MVAKIDSSLSDMTSFEDTDGDGIPNIPEKYATHCRRYHKHLPVNKKS